MKTVEQQKEISKKIATGHDLPTLIALRDKIEVILTKTDDFRDEYLMILKDMDEQIQKLETVKKVINIIS